MVKKYFIMFLCILMILYRVYKELGSKVLIQCLADRVPRIIDQIAFKVSINKYFKNTVNVLKGMKNIRCYQQLLGVIRFNERSRLDVNETLYAKSPRVITPLIFALTALKCGNRLEQNAIADFHNHYLVIDYQLL